MNITVKVFATIRTVMPGETRLDVADGSTIGDLLDILGKTYPGLTRELFSDKGVLRQFVNILQNGRNIAHLQGSATLLQAGDLIAIFPPAAGG
jgi:sulfur-carrier protein